MKITDILVRDACLLDLKAAQKPDALLELSQALAAAAPELEAQRLYAVLAEREKLQSTGIGDGVAIPHGKMPGLSRLVASFARSEKGVAFEAIDGGPTHLFFTLVVPEDAGGQHLKALARISRFFRDPAFRKALQEAPNTAALMRAIAEEDAKF